MLSRAASVMRRTKMSNHRSRGRMRFYGKVQFAGFRYTARLPAREPAFTGWVSGSVLPEAQWDTAWLRKLLIRLKSQGHFHIAKVTIRILLMKPDERHFRVCQSALPGTE